MKINFENQIAVALKDKLDDDDYAWEFYAALCNITWKHVESGKIYECTWRYAGGLVAQMRDRGEGYLDFYCSGNEGTVSEEIRIDMNELGWTPSK